jgi:hypothetical protein
MEARDRLPVLFGLQRYAPGIIQPRDDMAGVASDRQFARAARYGRPAWWRMVWRAAQVTAVAAAALTGAILVFALVPALPEQGPLHIQVIMLGKQWLELTGTGIAAAAVAVWVYTPTQGRRLSWISAILRAALCALFGAVGATSAVMLMIGRWPDEAIEHNQLGIGWADRTFTFMLVCVLSFWVPLTATLLLVPAAVRMTAAWIGERLSMLAAATAAGPAIVVVTLLALLPVSPIVDLTAQLWPLLLVSIAATAAFSAYSEAETSPRTAMLPTRRWPVLLGSMLCCVPLLAVLSGPVLDSLRLLAFPVELPVASPGTDSLMWDSQLPRGTPEWIVLSDGEPTVVEIEAGNDSILLATEGERPSWKLTHAFRIERGG